MNIELANRLVYLRKKNRYSKEELAVKLGISLETLASWEQAEASPDTDSLIALARLYQISMDELLNSAGYSELKTNNNTGSVNSDKTASRKVILKFQRNGLQKSSLLLCADFVIDGEKTIRVAPDTCVEAELESGSHTIRVAIPYQGNESGVVTTQVNLDSDEVYEITYSVSSFSAAGIITVNKRSNDPFSAQKSAPVVTKGHKNHNILIAMIMTVVIMGMVVLISNGVFYFSFGSNKKAVVTGLNTPGVSSGLKITATEIEVMKDEYRDKSIVAVYFEIENISKKEIYYSISDDLVYVDDIKAEATYDYNRLSTGDLAAGKRTNGYLYYYIPQGAERIEISFEVEFKVKFTFTLDIPAGEITEDESQPDTEDTTDESTESENTQSKTEKSITVTKLNTPGINAGLKITATEIKVMKPAYSDKLAAAVYFEVENQSDETVHIFLPSAYVDGTKSDIALCADNLLSLGSLDAGKRTNGYLYYNISDGAKNIEIKFEIGLDDDYINFSLDIPAQ